MKREDLQSNLAMTITLVMGAMLFATLFMGYAVYRTSAPTWPPMGIVKIGLRLPILSTLIIAVSSWFCYQTRLALQAENLVSARKNLNLTLAFGLAFMLVQSWLWFHLKQTGIYVSSGIFASVVYGFTWIHAAHVVLGMGALLYLKLILRSLNESVLRKAINVEKFWHFLGVIWIIMFITLFVL